MSKTLTRNDEIEVCKRCGSSDIELRMWVKINTGKVAGSCDDNETYCNGCEAIIASSNVTSRTKYNFGRRDVTRNLDL